MALDKTTLEQHAAQAFDNDRSLREVLEPLTGANNLPDLTDDTAAAGAGIPIGGLYRTGSAIKVRVA